MRVIEIDITSENKILYTPGNFGGFMGEHNASALFLKIPLNLDISYYRIVFSNADQKENNIITAPLFAENNELLFILPLDITSLGFVVDWQLVGYGIDSAEITNIAKRPSSTLIFGKSLPVDQAQIVDDTLLALPSGDEEEY